MAAFTHCLSQQQPDSSEGAALALASSAGVGGDAKKREQEEEEEEEEEDGSQATPLMQQQQQRPSSSCSATSSSFLNSSNAHCCINLISLELHCLDASLSDMRLLAGSQGDDGGGLWQLPNLQSLALSLAPLHFGIEAEKAGPLLEVLFNQALALGACPQLTHLTLPKRGRYIFIYHWRKTTCDDHHPR